MVWWHHNKATHPLRKINRIIADLVEDLKVIAPKYQELLESNDESAKENLLIYMNHVKGHMTIKFYHAAVMAAILGLSDSIQGKTLFCGAILTFLDTV